MGATPSEVWRGAAVWLLRLNARESELLAQVFEDEPTRDDTRLLILDLFAAAGTFEVQAILRRLLSLAVARRSNRVFASFVQRLGFVEDPDGPTLRYLMSVYAEARGEPEEIRSACAYALGACAGHAHRAGDEDAAVRATEMLRRDLFLVGTPSQKRALVLALGNAGLTTDLPAIVRAANDLEPQVRAAAAAALRKIDDREARAQLVSMLIDADTRVGESAILALSEHELDETEALEIADLVQTGRTPIALDGRILRLLVAQKTVLTSRGPRATQLENALRLLVGRVEAAVEASAVERRFGERGGSGSWQTAKTPVPPRMPGESGSVAPVMRSPSVPVMRASGFVARPSIPPAPAVPGDVDDHAFPPSSVEPPVNEDFRETVRRSVDSQPTFMAVGPLAPEPPEVFDAEEPDATEVVPPPDHTHVLASPPVSAPLTTHVLAPASAEGPSSEAPTMIRAPEDGHASEGMLAAPVARDALADVPANGAQTIAMSRDDAFAPGVYRLVPGEGGVRHTQKLGSPAHDAAVEAMRRRMRELGLNPDARTSLLPLPPPKSAGSK